MKSNELVSSFSFHCCLFEACLRPISIKYWRIKWYSSARLFKPHERVNCLQRGKLASFIFYKKYHCTYRTHNIGMHTEPLDAETLRTHPGLSRDRCESFWPCALCQDLGKRYTIRKHFASSEAQPMKTTSVWPDVPDPARIHRWDGWSSLYSRLKYVVSVRTCKGILWHVPPFAIRMILFPATHLLCLQFLL